MAQSVKRGSTLRRGLQRQRVQHAAHAALERVIDHLVLLHAGLALEGGGGDHGGVMVIVVGQVCDRHLRVGKRGP